ncbi:ricin-type beta-trefoil lectin domain protein [Streptomyces gamaensis]|uniref:Ricin-type beta-trefoil lectin domain protein n=1 Tax=Streptomyces gamaensis TaxID=1763542 RepID=A0ABW0Z4Q2_9ACTN
MAAPAALAAPQPAARSVVAGWPGALARSPQAVAETIAGHEVIEVKGLGGKTLRAVRIPIPDSKVVSSIVVALDRYSTGQMIPYDHEVNGREKAEAFVKRIEGNLGKLAGDSEGKVLLEGISGMSPLDVVMGERSPATGHADINTIIHRGFPQDPKEWTRDVLDVYEGLSPAEQEKFRELSSPESPYVRTFDPERHSNGIGSEGMVMVQDDPVVLISHQPDGRLVAMDESLILGHELVHVAHGLQGADAAREHGTIPVPVEYKDPEGNRWKNESKTSAEEISTLGGGSVKYIGHPKDGEPALGLSHFERSEKAVKDALSRSGLPDHVVKRLAEVQLARYSTFPISETSLANSRGVPVREHYKLPVEFALRWNLVLRNAEGKPTAVTDQQVVKLPEGLAFTEDDLNKPVRLKKILETEGVRLQPCSRGTSFMACDLGGQPEEVTEETKKRINEVEQFLKEHPDAKVQLPSADSAADRERARAEAVKEGEKWRGQARERAKELCAKSGHASCLETVDWERIRRQARAEAEALVEKKLAGTGKVSEIKLSKDIEASLKDPATFYVPYEETRGKLANPAGDLAWERVKSAGGAVLYLSGIYGAFAHDSTDLDKAAAVAAIVPGVGDLLNLATDIEHKDFAGLGVDAAASLAGLLEMAGVEGIGGPAFAVAMAYHLIAQLTADDFHRYEEVANAVAKRDKEWHDSLMNYLQDPEKGWLSKEGGNQVVAMAIGFLQAVELQRASVKATAHAATAAGDGGAHIASRTSDWARTDASKDADAAVDALADKTPDIVRQAAARSIADGMNAAWNEKQGKDFNQAYIDRVDSIQLGIWCGRSMPDGSNPCYESSQKMKAEVLENLKKNPPAGVTAKEVEDVLENFGLTDPGFLPLGRPFRLSNTSDGAKTYLHFDIENEKVTHAKDANDPARQEFFFRTTGRITTLEGGLCMAGGKQAGDPVTVSPCTHRNAPEQRWEPDGKGRIKNLATGLYLDSASPDGYVTTWSEQDGNPARQTWKAEAPARSMTPQTSNDAISKLLSAPGSSKQIDGVVPNQQYPDNYYLFSGANILGVSASSGGGDLKLSPGEVKKTTEHWEGLVPLFATSRDSRITAGMKVPGRPGELYLFSGDTYARLGADRKIINEPRSIEDNWATLKGLFAKSGVKRVDAIRPIPGVEDCFQFFSGAYSNQVCINDKLEDRETGSVQRNTERWPEVGANTGKDEVHGFLQVPGKPMANHIFSGDQFTYVDRSVLPAKPDVQFEFHATWTYFTFGWGNGQGLPEGAKIVVERSGDAYQKGEFDASLGKLSPDVDPARGILYNYPKDIVGSKSYTMTAHYRYVHPDGSEEISGQWSQGFWCSFWECNVPQE